MYRDFKGVHLAGDNSWKLAMLAKAAPTVHDTINK